MTAGEDGATQHFDFVVKEASQYASASIEILRENDAEISSDVANWPEAVDTIIEAGGASVIQAGFLSHFSRICYPLVQQLLQQVRNDAGC